MNATGRFTYQVDMDMATVQATARQLAQVYQQALAQIRLPALTQINQSGVVSQVKQQQAQITADASAQSAQRRTIAQNEANAEVQAAQNASSQVINAEKRVTDAVKNESRQRTQARQQDRVASFGREALGAFGIGLGVAGAIGLARQGVQTALELEKEATSYRRLQVAANNLAGSQARLNELMKVYDQATGGILSKQTQLQDVTRLMAVGFADSTQELKEFATAVRGISIATGQSQEYVAGQLQLAIANQSTMRLDQLGLGITEVKDRIAALRAENSALTEEEAYQIAILGAANDKFGALSNSIEAQKTGVEALTVAWQNWRLEVGQAVGPGVDAVATHFARLLDPQLADRRQGLQQDIDMRELWFDREENIEPLRKMVAAIDQITAAEQAGMPVNEAYTAMVMELAEEYAQTGVVTEAMANQINGLEQTYWATIAAQQAAGNETEILTGSLVTHEQQIANTRVRIAEMNEEWVKFQATIASTNFNGMEWMNIPGAGWQPVQGPSRIPSEEYMRQQDALNSGGLITIGGKSIADATMERDEERARKAEQEQTRAAREWESAAKKTATEMERAAEKMAQDFENALRAVPGLFGASPVTDDQMNLAKAGVPQNFADDYLRRLTDEVLNGVNWDDVDINDAARRAGIDQGLDDKTKLAMFRSAWEDSSLFANAANLDLINQSAVQAELARQQSRKAGEANILDLFGLSGTVPQGAEGANKYFTDAGGKMTTGLMGGAQEELASFGVRAVEVIAQGMTGEEAQEQWNTLGTTVGEAMVTAIETAIAGTDFVGVIVTEAVRRINEQMDQP